MLMKLTPVCSKCSLMIMKEQEKCNQIFISENCTLNPFFYRMAFKHLDISSYFLVHFISYLYPHPYFCKDTSTGVGTDSSHITDSYVSYAIINHLTQASLFRFPNLYKGSLKFSQLILCCLDIFNETCQTCNSFKHTVNQNVPSMQFFNHKL